MSIDRHIEAAAMVASPTVPTPGFTDRVMAALADEPGPAPGGFLAPLRKLGVVAGFGASIRQAWATLDRPGRPALARAAALGYVLMLAATRGALASGAPFGAASAFGRLGPPSRPAP